MRRKNNIVWHDEWIIANKNNYPSILEFYKAYVEKIDSTIHRQAFTTHLTRMGIHSNLSWTDEEKQWLVENFCRLGSLKCVEPFEQKFGKRREHRSLEACARRLGLLVDDEVVIANRNYPRRVPIGTIVDDGDGYLKIKTGHGSSGWERYHRYIYKKEHGAIPKGHKIVFLDGNRQNYSVENMVAVPASYLALMNNWKLKSQEPEITKASIKWCELYELLKKSNYVCEF